MKVWLSILGIVPCPISTNYVVFIRERPWRSEIRVVELRLTIRDFF